MIDAHRPRRFCSRRRIVIVAVGAVVVAMGTGLTYAVKQAKMAVLRSSDT